MNARPTLVALRALGLGDFLTAVPAYRALARAFPRYHRVLAAPHALHPLLPLLGDTFAGGMAAEPLGELPAAARDAAVAVNLHGRGPQSHRIVLAANPARLIAFEHPEVAESAGGAAWQPGEHEVARWCRMLAHAGLPADRNELAIDVPHCDVPAWWRGTTVVHPGAASGSRCWPVASWAHVARACEARGDRVVVTGGIAERERTQRVVALAGLPAERNVAGRTSLVELAALVAGAGRLLCGDTGIAHLASAYGTPSVVLFGPTAPNEWGPPARDRHLVLWSGTCGNPHAHEPDPGLLSIGIADVMTAIDRLDATTEAVRGV